LIVTLNRSGNDLLEEAIKDLLKKYEKKSKKQHSTGRLP